jgi:hypothetical protein
MVSGPRADPDRQIRSVDSVVASTDVEIEPTIAEKGTPPTEWPRRAPPERDLPPSFFVARLS